MPLEGRYAGLSSKLVKLHGREVSLVDLPKLPSIEDLGDSFFLIEDEQISAQDLDQMAAAAGMEEEDYWVIYALNFPNIEDPFKVPVIPLVVPSKELFDEMAHGADQT